MHAAALPEEIYIKLAFDSHEEAAKWCDSVIAALPGHVFDVGPLDRVVIWKPGEGQLEVHLSVLAMRVVRAVGGRYMPVRGVVSIAQLPPGLRMVRGSDADAQAYKFLKG
jgi:hypothetical protein